MAFQSALDVTKTPCLCSTSRASGFLDKDGRIWFGTPPNNRVGYFYLSTKQRNADAR